jgi:hypothetical protein
MNTSIASKEEILARIFRIRTPLEIQVRDTVQAAVGKVLSFKEQARGCVVCTSHKPENSGYTRISVKSSNEGLHRIIFFHLNPEVSKEMQVLHRCDNPPCCNPSHLTYGTNKDNAVDRENKGRGSQASGTTHYSSKLTATDIESIRSGTYRRGANKKLAERFNVDPSVISKIRNNKHYKEPEE